MKKTLASLARSPDWTKGEKGEGPAPSRGRPVFVSLFNSERPDKSRAGQRWRSAACSRSF